jgi:hypothetical protein
MRLFRESLSTEISTHRIIGSRSSAAVRGDGRLVGRRRWIDFFFESGARPVFRLLPLAAAQLGRSLLLYNQRGSHFGRNAQAGLRSDHHPREESTEFTAFPLSVCRGWLRPGSLLQSGQRLGISSASIRNFRDPAFFSFVDAHRNRRPTTPGGTGGTVTLHAAGRNPSPCCVDQAPRPI